MNPPVTVYALRERGSLLVRYVGVSGYAAHRFVQHKRAAAAMSPMTPLAHWLNTADVEMVELGDHDGDVAGHAAERAMIKALIALGHPLFNHRSVPADKRITRVPTEQAAA